MTAPGYKTQHKFETDRANINGQCTGSTKAGNQCSRMSVRNSDRCAQHHRKPQAGSFQSKSGVYYHHLEPALKTIYDEIEAQGKIEDLSRTDVEEELKTSRLLLAQLLGDPLAEPDTRMKALNTVRNIVRTAKQIKDIDANMFRQELMESLLTAIVYSFQKATTHNDPAERAATFIREISLFFPNADEGLIEGEVVGK